MNTNKKKEHNFLMGEVFDKTNKWSTSERVFGFFGALLLDPILAIGKAMNSAGIETEGELNDWDFKNP